MAEIHCLSLCTGGGGHQGMAAASVLAGSPHSPGRLMPYWLQPLPRCNAKERQGTF